MESFFQDKSNSFLKCVRFGNHSGTAIYPIFNINPIGSDKILFSRNLAAIVLRSKTLQSYRQGTNNIGNNINCRALYYIIYNTL